LRRQDWPKSLELVGPEVFSFQNLMQKMASVKGRAFSSFPVPNSLVGALTRNFISIWFPGLVQYDEFQLGLKDQTGNVAQLEAFLGRKTLPTSPFWDEIQW